MAAVEVAVHAEIIKIIIVIVGTSMSSAMAMVMVDIYDHNSYDQRMVVADIVVAVAMAAKTPKEIAVTQYTTACCSVQVIHITLTKYRFANITSLRVVQQKHCGSATLHVHT
jgi:hypothetical protein